MSVQSLATYLGSAWLCCSCTSRHSVSIDPSQVYNQRGWSHIMKQASPCWAEAFLALSEGDSSHQLLGTATALSSPNPFVPSQSGHLGNTLSRKIWLLVDKTLNSSKSETKKFFQKESLWVMKSLIIKLFIVNLQSTCFLIAVLDWQHSTQPHCALQELVHYK